MNGPAPINDRRLRFDSFAEDNLFTKKPRLPAMGWNSWNAFGSGNTEELTKAMVLKLKELKLDKLGFKYVVLDDGCYHPERVNGHLQADNIKFPSGFKAMADFVHENGLKFGMYNDIGTRLCSGAEVGIYGFEKTDCEDYIKWDIDFIKVDNCYYMWDNATFADPENAKYSYAPNIKRIEVDGISYDAEDAEITGTRAEIKDGYATYIGTFDGTAPDHSPVGLRSSELVFQIRSDEDKKTDIKITYASGASEGVGQWLQVAVGENIFYDALLAPTESPEAFTISPAIPIELSKGINKIRIMNHRRQENTLHSYAEIRHELENAGDRDIVFSICEWGKTQPQNWGHKAGDSWRILNDITFQVGSDGDHGTAAWEGDYTTAITSQYNKAVIMDEFAGLGKGWNDPDMLVIGMDGIDETMCRSHMAMWCMLNSPLMLGLDLRRVTKGDSLYNIIANKDLIALNQDALGVQAKRIFTTYNCAEPDKEYIRDNNRIDILAKPLANGDIALGFFNLSKERKADDPAVSVETILNATGAKTAGKELFANAKEYRIKDLFTQEEYTSGSREFKAGILEACDCKVIRITPLS